MPTFWLVKILMLVRLATTLGLLIVNSYIISSTTTHHASYGECKEKTNLHHCIVKLFLLYYNYSKRTHFLWFSLVWKAQCNIMMTLGKLAIHNPEASYSLALSPSCSPNIRRSFVMLRNPKKMQNNWTVSVRYWETEVLSFGFGYH